MNEQSRQSDLWRAGHNIQANLVRTSKFADSHTRNWTVFFFFRIMTEDEVEATGGRALDMMKHPDEPGPADELRLDYELPSLLNAGRRSLRDRRAGRSPVKNAGMDASGGIAGAVAAMEAAKRPPPAKAFLHWLEVLASAEKADMLADAAQLAQMLAAPSAADLVADVAALDAALRLFADADPSRAPKLEDLNVAVMRRCLELYVRVLGDPAQYRKVLRVFGATSAAAGARALESSLCGLALYELLRQGAPAFASDAPSKTQAVIRSEVDHRLDVAGDRYDPCPINISFTYAGLQALDLDDTTLKSFPEPFRQGMAERAQRLNDTGPSAPAGWDCEYGLSSIHGYFTGGFLAGSPDRRIKESVWRRLRGDIAAFNERKTAQGRFLRAVLGMLFRQMGLEIVHIELGQDPYEVCEKTGDAIPLPYRVEHFGFRDGLSQPFVDLGLGDTLPGGGTPDREGTWSPVAPGEIYLDLPDEDGEVQQLPISPELRQGGTYVVFRKLEQDVRGFHTFLGRQRPQSHEAAVALSAQFVGRWPNGTPLVVSPDAPREVDAGYEAALNNFRYAADDPYGQRCPLGAHIRRANPRDTGGRGEVKRHRILRRGIAYGGPLLPPGSLGDGHPRGLFFIAVNSRIDLQFELIQADWINNGEFLGQAGLSRCPVVGGNDGGVQDSFLEAGRAAPVVGLPRFVVTRGGDYFFAPGVVALQHLAKGCKFGVNGDGVPYHGFTMGDAATLGLFDPNRVALYTEEILNPEGDSIVRVRLPPEPPEPPAAEPACRTIVFVGRHDDVTKVLSDPVALPPAGAKGEDAPNACPYAAEHGRLEFSVLQYHLTGQRITRGHDFLVGGDAVGETAAARRRHYMILCKAWQALEEGLADDGGVAGVIAGATQKRLDAALRRTASTRRIDLVHDLAVQASYGVLTDLFGTPGPTWLTELAPALPLGSQHVASLPADWLTAARGDLPPDPGLTSMQIWSVLILADVLGNLQSQHEAWPLSRQAGSEMLTHLDAVLADAYARSLPERPPKTLVEALVKVAPCFVNGGGEGRFESREDYFRQAAVILMELVGDTLAAIPATFGHVVDFLLKNRIDLPRLLEILHAAPPPAQGQPTAVQRLIYESERLNPILPVLLRHCEETTELPSGEKICKDEWVAAILAAADLDEAAFTQPEMFSLAPFMPGPPRDPANYLAFGAIGGSHECWGRDLVALPVLVQCVEAAGLLEGLRGVAGPAGNLQTLLGVTVGRPARFTQVASPVHARTQAGGPPPPAYAAGKAPAPPPRRTQSRGPLEPA
jgi:deferrochelatase/peroxidase EfeB/cytochrome P450